MKKVPRKTLEKTTKPSGAVVLYRAKDGKTHLEVRVGDETVWLMQQQIAALFGIQRPAITKHLRNIFKTKELEEKRVCSILEHTGPDGKKYQVQYYSLDAIISIGYRTNSALATQFRIWATNTLKGFLFKGYAINERRLLEQTEKFKELQTAINFLKQKSSLSLLSNQAEGLLTLLESYATSLTLFYQYDKGKLSSIGRQKPIFTLTYEVCRELTAQTKKLLLKKREAGSLFGQEYGEKIKGIVGTIYQTFGGKELYLTVEAKAAHLLYFTIKDHPFADGNKRLGSILFVYFLEHNNFLRRANGERKITDTTLVALALLVAASDPKEKETMVKLIINLLK